MAGSWGLLVSSSGDAAALAADLREEVTLTIRAAQMWHPRSQQQAVGPSELGGPCERKLGYKLARHPKVRDDEMSWRATVGVSVHAWLDKTFGKVMLPDGTPRYLTEVRVMCGHVGGVELWGTCDAYDKATTAALDWKIASPASLKRMRGNIVGPTYRAQRHLYGLGLIGAGHPVSHVGNVILPSAGELSDMHVDIEPFDITVALDVLARANRITAALDALPAATVLGGLDTAEEWCARSCPWFRPGSTDVTSGCPGVLPPRAAPALTLVGADLTIEGN